MSRFYDVSFECPIEQMHLLLRFFKRADIIRYELPNKPEWKKYEHNQGRQIHYCTSSEKWFCYHNLTQLKKTCSIFCSRMSLGTKENNIFPQMVFSLKLFPPLIVYHQCLSKT